LRAAPSGQVRAGLEYASVAKGEVARVGGVSHKQVTEELGALMVRADDGDRGAA
jgi:hypothetical protein